MYVLVDKYDSYKKDWMILFYLSIISKEDFKTPFSRSIFLLIKINNRKW